MASAGDVNFSPGLPFLVSGEACFAVLFDCCCCRNRCRLSRPTLPRIYARCNIFFLVSGFFRIFHRIFPSFFIDYAPNTAPVFPQHLFFPLNSGKLLPFCTAYPGPHAAPCRNTISLRHSTAPGGQQVLRGRGLQD